MKTIQQLHEFIINTNTAILLSNVTEKQISQTLKPLSIYFLSNFTINPIEPILKLYLHESNIAPNLTFGQYDNAMQEVLDEFSILRTQLFDIVVCANYYDPLDPAFLNRLNSTESFILELKNLFDLVQENTQSLVLINTFILPSVSESGITSVKNPTRIDAILEINRFIRNYTKQHADRCFLLDWTRYCQLLGENESIDYRYRYIYKAPFKKAFLSYYAADIAKIARALKGYAKKCLILDCDNTLWGGIVGEEGSTGIKLDNHDYPGKIFYDFQNTVLELSKRGVILALCSKNNAEDVWEVFDSHPYSLLHKDHFAAAKINWLSKADNIIDLIQELNIGVESCVFLDDSPTECELVKLALPDITVVQVPNPIYEYPSLLLKEGLFDTLTINKEDSARNLQYQQESERKEILKKSQNITEYLTSLELVATIHFVKENEFSRIAQLTQKTNQFNLSTRRYTEPQIKNFHQSDDSVVFSLSVKDKFGDYGLTGVLIAKRAHDNNTIGIIDTFLVSCRILSRNLEHVFLETCLKQLSQYWSVNQWQAEYIRSDKNKQIEDFLIKSKFNTIDNQIYFLNMKEWDGFNINYITLIEEGLEYA